MRNHYEKVITLCCFLFLFVNVGMPSTSFNVYQPYLVALPAIGDTGASTILASRTLVSLLAMVFVDRYYRALDIRRGVLAASVLTFLGFVIFSFAQTLPLFILGTLFTGCAYGLGGMVAATMLINRWYKAGVGEAIGLASMGSGICAIIVPFATARIIEYLSLSTAFLVEGTCGLVISVIVFLMLRNRPSDMGLEPFEGKDAAKEKADRRTSYRPARIPRAMQVLLIAAMVAVGMFTVGGGMYESVLLTSQGYDTLFAASMLSVTGAALAASKFATGEIFDHLGTPRGTALAYLVLIAGLVCLCATPTGSTAIALAGAVLFGLGMALGTVGISVWSIELADAANTARSIKNYQMGYALGGFLMNAIPGPLKALTGTYVTSYALMLVAGVFSGIVILAAYRLYRRPHPALDDVETKPGSAPKQESAAS